MDIKQRLEASKALDFLRNHPAFAFENGDSLCSGIWFSMEPCCKYGYTEHAGIHGVTLYSSDPRFKDFDDLLKEQYSEEELKNSSDFLSIEVPYERLFGEPWSYDHMEYWYEMTFFVFTGNPYKLENSYDAKFWSRYGGPEGSANTFEEMLIKVAKEVKEVFGDFNINDHFHTTAELLNQKNTEHVFWIPCDDSKCKRLEWNNKYVNVYNGLINLRWIEWFMTTDYAKKNWQGDFEMWQRYIDNIKYFEEQERRDNLAPYENSNIR